MILYKFRELGLKDMMILRVDFYGEPVEVTEEEIENHIKENLRVKINGKAALFYP